VGRAFILRWVKEIILKKQVTLRKIGSQFIETIASFDARPPAVRWYRGWDEVGKRLRQIGVATMDIALLKSDFDLGNDTALTHVP
jgi:hypothetical protein